jgi:hypothetical protein
VLLADHLPGGGATLFVEGMHAYTLRLYQTWTKEERDAKHAAQRAAVSRSHSWLAELQHAGGRRRKERTRYFMERDEVTECLGGRELDEPMVLSVQEMTGKAGDISLLHPLLGQSGAPNASARPRIMRSKLAS